MKRKTLRAPAGSNEYFMHIDTGVKIQPPEAPKVYDIFWLPGLYPRKEQEEEKLEDVENIDLIADDNIIDLLDADGDGDVEWDEALPVFLKQGMSEKEARKLFNVLDESGDGTISPEEFKNFKDRVRAGRDPEAGRRCCSEGGLNCVSVEYTSIVSSVYICLRSWRVLVFGCYFWGIVNYYGVLYRIDG